MPALNSPIPFDRFIEGYPESNKGRYELHRGTIVEMPKPKGRHSEIGGFLSGILFLHLQHYALPYFIPRECVIRANGESGYEPDVIVLDTEAVRSEPQWESSSVIAQGSSVRLVIGIVSTNWRDDYYLKLSDYEAIGIPEYWIVDYAALEGRKFIGNPKHPTLGVYTLTEGEYSSQQFRGQDRIISASFPDLRLTVDQVLSSGLAQ